MPLFFGAIGIVLIICALNNTLHDLSGLIRGDFTGQNNFLIWIVAIGIVGAVGYIPKFKPVSNAFLLLILMALVLANQKGASGGLFTQFFTAVNKAGTTPGYPSDVNQSSSTGSNQSSSGSGGFGDFGKYLADFTGGNSGGGGSDASTASDALDASAASI